MTSCIASATGAVPRQILNKVTRALCSAIWETWPIERERPSRPIPTMAMSCRTKTPRRCGARITPRAGNRKFNKDPEPRDFGAWMMQDAYCVRAVLRGCLTRLENLSLLLPFPKGGLHFYLLNATQ